MITRLLSGSAATLVLSAAILAQSPSNDPAPDAIDSSAVVADAPPELMLKPVPPILRLHLPMLGPNLGVLVESVSPGSPSEKTGLRSGDVILEAGGRRVAAGTLAAPMDSALPIVVIRRGRIQTLNFGRPRHGFYGRNEGFATNQPGFGGPPIGYPGNFPGSGFSGSGFSGNGVSVASSASSSSIGGRAVSISRSGDQISLEMSLPNLAEGPIRLQGTAAEIEQQLQSSALVEAAKNEVRAALRQAR